MATSIYDYTPAQADLIRFYDLYRCCLMSEKHHWRALKEVRKWSAATEALAAVSASSAVAGLAIWRTTVGGIIFTSLLVVSAIASIARAALRMSEKIDRHSRLAYTWHELSLDMDKVRAEIRSQGMVDVVLRGRVEDLCARFQRIEMGDDIEICDDEEIRKAVDAAVPPESLWLPVA